MAQKTQQTDSQGRKQGLWTETVGRYGILCRGLYKDNLRQGLWKWYRYQSYWDSDNITEGSLYAEVNYVDGLKQGLQKWYYPDGVTLHEEGHYLDDKQHGLWKWYRRDGTLESEGHYLNGGKHGLWKNYRRDGSYKKISFWKQDELLQENVLLLFLGYIDLIP